MKKLTRDDLHSLEKYAERRKDFQAEAVPHKNRRKVHLGDHVTIFFEDRLTMQYQIQEILRVEKTIEPDAIQEELDAYNPLIPDGTNLKATLMIEYDDRELRQRMLAKLVGIEDTVWVRVAGFDKVFPYADEDMERDTAEKTSSVHFLRFELDAAMIAAAKSGTALGVGIDFPGFEHSCDPLPEDTRAALAADFEPDGGAGVD